MNRLQRVLLVDDQYDEFQDEVAVDFQQNDIDIRFCRTKDEAIDLIDLGIQFDLVILDWFLDGDESLLSRLFLKELRQKSFVPVFIWSEHIDHFNATQAEAIDYPKTLIEGIAKDEVTTNILQERIARRFQESLPAQISSIYRNKIRFGLEKVFFDLVQLPNQDIASLLKFLVGDGQNIDWSNDFILNLVHRELIGDTSFCEDLRTLLQGTESAAKLEHNEERRQILSKVLYYKSDAQFIRCGDIVRFQIEDNETRYGIVVTPACDLEQRHTKFLELVELRRFDDRGLALNSDARRKVKKYNEPSWYLLPAIPIEDNLFNFTAIFKSKIILEQHIPDNKEKYPKTTKRPEYSDTCLFRNREMKLEFLCRLDNPYRNDFLQKFHAHNSRVGIPNIRSLLE